MTSAPTFPRLYHGVDLVSVARLQEVMDRNPAFVERAYTEGERAYCDAKAHPHIHYAARFAAKEAALKALGVGLSPIGIDRVLLEIEVEREVGPPRLALHGRMAEAAKRLGIFEVSLSLSHTEEQAVASVVMMGISDAAQGGEGEAS
jgi:holo-[acyl-carrier protein] synthase